MCYWRAGGMIQTTKYRNYCKMGYNGSSAKRKIAPPPASPHDHHRLPRTKYMHALWCSEIHDCVIHVPSRSRVFPGFSRRFPELADFSKIFPETTQPRLVPTTLVSLWKQLNKHEHIQIHTDTYRYIQIHTDTYRYIQIHTDTNRYIQIHTGSPLEFPLQNWERWGQENGAF